MVFLVFWALGVLLAAIHVFIRRSRFDRRQVIETFLLYQIALGFGLGGLFGFMGHGLDPVQTAQSIGWPPAPEFQFELAAFELGLALAAVLCLFVRNKFYWLGVVIAPSVFFLLAAAQHVYGAIEKGNFAPNNVLIIAPDVLIPLTILLLLVWYFRCTAGASPPRG